MGDMVRSFEPFCLQCTVRRKLCPLTGQISKTFMALIRFPRVVGTADTDTEKSGFSFVPTTAVQAIRIGVASTTGWLSTSLKVTKGQELSFSAVGSWTVD